MDLKWNEKKFYNIYPDVDTFVKDMGKYGIPKNLLDEDYQLLYYLLFAKYGDFPLCGYSDETRWRMRLQSIIYQYGGEWKKKLEIQENVRALTVEELQKGSTSIYNHAYNPSSGPSTDTLEEVSYINDQNTSKIKRGKAEAYQLMWDLIDSDVTERFLVKFKKLFSQFPTQDVPLYIYENEGN